jgi:hypothetical protein
MDAVEGSFEREPDLDLCDRWDGEQGQRRQSGEGETREPEMMDAHHSSLPAPTVGPPKIKAVQRARAE